MLSLILADSSTQIVDAIWPTSSTVCRSELGSKAVLPLRTFIQETLRRSRTSYSTLQVALYYLILIKPHVPIQNFITEQLDDRHATQALQCGRRMFLAALILASKYLQDRNYSARAWSKISGLNTQEINQNEMAFLQAVNWKLHIADDVFQRWTDIVLKYTPSPSPPSPGGAPQLFIQKQHDDWRRIILGLNTELTNLEGLLCTPQSSPTTSDLSPMSPRSILNTAGDASDWSPAAKKCSVPMVMEPMPTSMCAPGRLAPALTFLPTPRPTPQTGGLCTPAVCATVGKGSSMGLAMAQANTVSNAQYLDRLPISVSPSPQVYCPARRSSLANSISTASSPESMVSDSSRSSRSSSISSASSLASATLHSKSSAPSRFRAAKLGNERLSSRPTVPSVPEDYDEACFSSSPESYTGPVGRFGDWTMGNSMAGRKRQLDDMANDAASDAARTLQELHSYRESPDATPTLATIRRAGTSTSLQDNVRSLLNSSTRGGSVWPNTLVRSRGIPSEPYVQAHVPEFSQRKRVCCSAEAASGYESTSVHPAIGLRGPGVWQSILN